MPNRVKTKIFAPREILDDIIKNYVSEYKVKYVYDENRKYLDFQKIIPAPKYIYQWDLSCKDEKKYWPENCWYKWNVKNWWTKWNSWDFEDYWDHIEIITAWDVPLPIIRELAMIYEWTEFLIKYADEDIWNNCWMFSINWRELGENKIFTSDEVFATMIRYNCSEKEAEEIIKNWYEEE